MKLVKITNGRLKLGRTLGHWKPLVLEQVNLELRDFSATTAFPFSLAAKVAGGGTIQLDGKAGPINPTDSAMTPVNASLKVTQLDLARSGMSDFAPDVAGLVSIDGTGSSDGLIMQVDGKVKAEKVKLARKGTPATRPVEFDFSARHDLRKHSGTLRRGDIHIGAAPAHLTGTYAEQGEAMVLNMTLAGPNMPVPELATLLPALGVVLPAGSSLEGGTASVMLTMEGPADRLVTSGSLALNNVRLTGFDLPKKMATIEKLAGMQGGPDTEHTDAERQRASGAGRDQRAGHEAAGSGDRRADRRRNRKPGERSGFQDERDGSHLGAAGGGGEHAHSVHRAGDVREPGLPAGLQGVGQRRRASGGLEKTRSGTAQRAAGREEELRSHETGVSVGQTPTTRRAGPEGPAPGLERDCEVRDSAPNHRA